MVEEVCVVGVGGWGVQRLFCIANMKLNWAKISPMGETCVKSASSNLNSERNRKERLR